MVAHAHGARLESAHASTGPIRLVKVLSEWIGIVVRDERWRYLDSLPAGREGNARDLTRGELARMAA
jgi:hypothetical protein